MQTSIKIGEDEVGHFCWAKHFNREDSTCVSGMNPDEECVSSFTLRYMLEFLRIPEEYPSAILHELEINLQFQRRGYGSIAMMVFENQAIEEGCKFALCAIGFNGESEMRKNVAFYQACGYKIFHHDKGRAFRELPATGTYWSLAFKQLGSPKHNIYTRGLTFTTDNA